MFTSARLLIELIWHPISGMERLRNRAPVGVSILAAWMATIAYAMFVLRLPRRVSAFSLVSQAAPGVIWLRDLSCAVTSSLMVVLFISVIYVPLAILIANLIEKRGSFSTVLREEFAPALACVLASWAISVIIGLAVALGLSALADPSTNTVGVLILLLIIPLPIFAALTSIAVGTVFRIGWAASVIATLVSFVSLFLLPLLVQIASFVCASPLLLILLFFLLRDQIGEIRSGQRARQSFKQSLEASTLNPADASAHFNLGLLYEQRGEKEKAEAEFRRAVEIDPEDADAHYQLGRIAREQGRLEEAREHFESVVRSSPQHSQHEIWRETALLYYSARQYQDALAMLDRFLDARPSDAEGRYWRGLTLAAMGNDDAAEAEMKLCIESVRTAPAYKYRSDRQWLRLAQSFLRERQA
jgi:tetratricopeptide (TPR) repeat protein